MPSLFNLPLAPRLTFIYPQAVQARHYLHQSSSSPPIFICLSPSSYYVGLSSYPLNAHDFAVIYSLSELLVSSKTNYWNTFLAVIPCFNNHANGLHHSNRISRCVTILTISFVVLISTTYYQTLLLSSFLINDPPVPSLSMQEIVQENCVDRLILLRQRAT